MQNVLLIIQAVVSVLIVTAILLQPQGSGLGSTWGGGGETYHAKRGVEKVVFYATIVLAVIFCVVSLLALTV